MLLLLLLLRCVLLRAEADLAPTKVCIIGGGMAGASAAHFLRNYSDEGELEIHVFERNGVPGGRMAMVELQGDRFEAGASILHPKNLHAARYVELLGLKKKSSPDSLNFGIWNGKEFIFQTRKFGKYVPAKVASFINSIALLWRYGTSLFKMNSFVERLLSRFMHFYDEDRAPYVTIEDLLESVSLYDYTQHPLDTELLREGLSELLITEMVTVISRINYGQNVSISGLAGAVSLCGSGGELWAVQGGNWQMADGLLKLSNVSLHLNRTVISVDTSDDTYQLKTSAGDMERCEAVVVATPLDASSITFTPHVKLPTRYMHHTFATFVRGCLNGSYFHVTDDSVPDLVGTLEIAGLPFISISVLKEHSSKDKAYKIFSRSALSDDLLDQVFSLRTTTIVIDWPAYPEYSAPETFAPIMLDSNHLYYVNAFENAASTMETSAIAAQNVARLLLTRLSTLSKVESSADKESNPRDELK